MSENIYTIAILKAKEGCLGDLKDILSVLATETRKEPGAIEYFFVQDVNHDPNTIVSYEKWQNTQEEAQHWQTPHLNPHPHRYLPNLRSCCIYLRGIALL